MVDGVDVAPTAPHSLSFSLSQKRNKPNRASMGPNIVWRPSPIATKEGSQYYVSFINDHTRYCWIYLMKHHFKFFEIYTVFRALVKTQHYVVFFVIYTAFRALVKTQHYVVIKCFRCDLGGEYISNKLCEFFAFDGTIHQTSCRYS